MASAKSAKKQVLSASDKEMYRFHPQVSPHMPPNVFRTYMLHRKNLQEVVSKTDTSPPIEFFSRNTRSNLVLEKRWWKKTAYDNQQKVASLVKVMCQPSTLDCHNSWTRNSYPQQARQTLMLKQSYENIHIVRRINEASTNYSRADQLNSWKWYQYKHEEMSKYCHDWRDPKYTVASLCPDFQSCHRRRHTNSAAPRLYPDKLQEPLQRKPLHVTKPSDIDSVLSD